MTDAMSAEDIDHVLANIRKLVSVEHPERAKSGNLLMLTSDLRVKEPAANEDAPEEAVDPEQLVEDEAGWPALDLPDPDEDLPQTFEVVTERSARPKSLEERIAGLQSAIASDPAVEFEPDGSEDQAQHLPDRVPSFRPDRASGHEGSPLRLAVAVEDGQRIGDADESIDDPLEDDADAADPSMDAELRFFHAPDRDGFGRHGYAGREDPLALGDEEQLLDEDALRDLVAEIVREELAGALGERITRNVRKLVRREIMRALSAWDFD